VKRLFTAAVLLAAGTSSLRAQVVDTTRADSLARDTTDYTGQFLKAQQDARRLIPVPPRIGAGTLLPRLTRFVFNQDSILWHNAETVSDVLSKIPGVYLLRGGWAGSAELPAYQARGPGSVEFLLDGVPYLPMGEDSLAVDPSVLPLSFLDRIEVERLPGLLRVMLFTRRHDRSVPYSRIGIASGDLEIARYQGIIEKRSEKGVGLAAAFDHFSVPAQPSRSGDYGNTQGLIRLDYIRSDRFGAVLQYLRNSPDREAVLGQDGDAPADTLSRARRGSRTDLSARVFLARGGGTGLGPRLDLVVARTSWHDELLKDSTRVITVTEDDEGEIISTDTTYTLEPYRRSITQAGLVAAWRSPGASLEASGFWRSARTPIDLRARGGLAPSPWLTGTIDAVYQRHELGRANAWVTGRAGITLPMGFSVSAVWRKGYGLLFPMIRTELAHDLDDRSLFAAWRSRPLEVEVGLTSNAGFSPRGFAQYPGLDSVAPSGRTQWITVNARLSPRQWFSVDGWYSTPRGTRPEGQPPTHSRVNATIQTKFLPTFRSGIFTFKLQGTMETWGTGVLARTLAGDPVIQRGATQFRAYIGIQIGAFMAYYDRYNLLGASESLGYVPRLGVPGYASTFGVRWEFLN
jgi:hypothetical protein